MKSLAMSLWKWLLQRFEKPSSAGGGFSFDEELRLALRALAEREGRREEEVAREMLGFALARRLAGEEYLARWKMLTPRQQQVVALLCQDYSTRQIAERLVVSPETVKSHLHNALLRLDLRGQTELRQALADWDFSAWERG